MGERMDSKLLSLRNASQVLGVSDRTVARLVARGELEQSMDRFGRPAFTMEMLEAYVARSKIEPGSLAHLRDDLRG